MAHPPENQDRVTRLALLAAQGNRTALTTFIQETHNDVWQLLAHLGGPTIADDLTQETYLRVISALPRFAGRSSAQTWLLSLARRVWIDHLRHTNARPRTASAVEHLPESAAPNTYEWIDTRLLLDALQPERREALILTQILGYTYEEAATIIGVRIGTIRSRVARARKDLLEKISDETEGTQSARSERET